MFLEKIEPYITSEYTPLTQFTAEVLEDYPMVPEKWAGMLLDQAVSSPEKEAGLLPLLRKHRFPDASLPLVLQKGGQAGENRYIYEEILLSFSPEVLAANKKAVLAFIGEQWEVPLDLLAEGGREEVRSLYESLLDRAAADPEPDQLLFLFAKKAMDTLADEGWLDEREAAAVMNYDSSQEMFSLHGIYLIRAAGRLQLKEYTYLIAGCLMREDDWLREEAADALIAFQDEEAVRAAASYLKEESCFTYAASILAQIKSELAASILLQAFEEAESAGEKAILAEALCSQLSESAREALKVYAEQQPFSEILPNLKLFLEGYLTIVK